MQHSLSEPSRFVIVSKSRGILAGVDKTGPVWTISLRRPTGQERVETFRNAPRAARFIANRLDPAQAADVCAVQIVNGRGPATLVDCMTSSVSPIPDGPSRMRH